MTSVSSLRWLARSALAVTLALVVSQVAWAADPPSPIPLRRPNAEYRVHTIDVDQGQAILVQTLNGKNILIDAGEDYAAPRLVGYLKKVGVKKIDWLVISHRHMDHIAGVGPLAHKFPVENVVTPWAKDAVPTTALAWMAPLRKDISKPFGAGNRPKLHTAVTGKTFDFGGGAKAEVVWPPKATGKLKIGDHNEESVVMRVTQQAPGDKKGASFVVGGDLGWQLEKHIAKKYPHLLKADGMVGNHHGSGGSFERKYLEAVAGRSSPLLKALNNPSSPEGKIAQQVVKYAQRKHGKDLASAVGLRLYRQVTSGAAPKDDKLTRSVAAAFKNNVQGGQLPWMTYSAGNDNPYHHPNSGRMALATMLGTTMLGTDVHGNIVMSRKLGKDGKWQGRWEGHTLGNLNLPDVSGDMPEYKKKKDPKNPYDGAARTANYIFALKQPDPTAKWEDKENFLAAPGQTENEKFLDIARNARRGKGRFIRQLVAKLRSDDPKVKAQAEAFALKWTKWSWHNAPLDRLPWDQGQDTVFAADKNSRLKHYSRGFGSRRIVLRKGGLKLASKKLQTRRPLRATRNSVLGKRQSPWLRGLTRGASLKTTVTQRGQSRTQVRQATRNSLLGRRLFGARQLRRPARWRAAAR